MSAKRKADFIFISLEAHRTLLAQRGLVTVRSAKALLNDVGVACLQGEHFGRPDHELSLHLGLVDFDGGAVLKAQALAGVVNRSSEARVTVLK